MSTLDASPYTTASGGKEQLAAAALIMTASEHVVWLELAYRHIEVGVSKQGWRSEAKAAKHSVEIDYNGRLMPHASLLKPKIHDGRTAENPG